MFLRFYLNPTSPNPNFPPLLLLYKIAGSRLSGRQMKAVLYGWMQFRKSRSNWRARFTWLPTFDTLLLNSAQLRFMFKKLYGYFSYDRFGRLDQFVSSRRLRIYLTLELRVYRLVSAVFIVVPSYRYDVLHVVSHQSQISQDRIRIQDSIAFLANSLVT